MPRRRAGVGLADHGSDERAADDDGGREGDGGDGAATAPPAPAGHGAAGQAGRDRRVLDGGRELRTQLGVERHRWAPDRSVEWARMTAIAREAWDFTAPALQPSASAIWASERSS